MHDLIYSLKIPVSTKCTISFYKLLNLEIINHFPTFYLSFKDTLTEMQKSYPKFTQHITDRDGRQTEF